MEQEKNNKGVIALLVVIIVILLALVVLLATGTISFKIGVNSNAQTNENNNSSQNSEDNSNNNTDNIQQMDITQLKGSYTTGDGAAVFKIYTRNGKNVLYKAKAGANAFGEIMQVKTISSSEVELIVLFNDKENLVGYDYKLNETSVIKLDVSQITNGIIKELDLDNFTYNKKDCNNDEDIYDNACQALKHDN